MQALTVILLLLISINVSYANKPKHVLKKIGKRLTPDVILNLYKMKKVDKIHLANWIAQGPKKVEAEKFITASMLAFAFKGISSTEDSFYDRAEGIIDKHTAFDMTADICGVNLNRYQFKKYLRRRASEFYPSQDPESSQEYVKVLPTDNSTLNAILKFNLTTKHDITAVQEFEIKASLVSRPDTKKLDNFQLDHVSFRGACTEHGTADLSLTDINKDTLENLKNNKDAKLFLKRFTPSFERKFDEFRTSIPELWLSGLDPSMNASICDEGKPIEYTQAQFLSWYKRFDLMWHPKKREEETYMNVQMLKVDPHQLIGRVSMKLQMGRDENATVHDWNFRIVSKYNLHGDSEWTVTRVEVLCPPTLDDIKVDSINAMRVIAAEKYTSSLNDKNIWRMSLDFLEDFIAPGSKVEFSFCDNTVHSLSEFEKDVWSRKNMDIDMIRWPGRWDFYYMTENLDSESSFKMDMVFRTNLRQVPDMDWHSVWTFTVRWDDMDQFYYITKLDLTCIKNRLHEATLRSIIRF